MSQRKIHTTRPILPPHDATPKILTERLLLRPFTPADLAPYHAIRSDPEVMRFSYTHAPDTDLAHTETELTTFLSPASRIEGQEAYLFAVEERVRPGVLVGDMGCSHATPGEENVGYLLAKRCWGKGYATEGLDGFLRHWFGELERTEAVIEENGGDEDEGGKERTTAGDGLHAVVERRERLTAICEVENVASIRVLEKCGFRRVRNFMEKTNGDNLLELELARPESI